MDRRDIAEGLAWTACGILATVVGAKAAEPVETKGWDGAKEALALAQEQETVTQSKLAPTPPAPAPLFVCYRPVTLDTAEGPVGALALFLGQGGDNFLWPIENAVGLSVTDAVFALGEDSVLSYLDPANVKACPPEQKIDLHGPKEQP